MSRIYEQPSMTPDDTAVFAIEKGADNNWTTYKTTWGSLKTLLSAATDIQYNAETGVFTFTKTDGNVITITPHDPTKVDKVNGKGLSENDFTNTLKTKLDNIASGAEVNVQSDWNQSDDEADDFIKNKPTIPTVDTALDATSENAIQNKAVKSALDDKVDAVDGKGLSTEDYTTAEKTKLAGVETGANNYVLPPATSSTIGGVKPGTNLSVDANGVLSMDSTSIVSTTESWLNDHIDPTTGYAVDNTLSTAGAAADAKAAGDAISDLNNALTDVRGVVDFTGISFETGKYVNVATGAIGTSAGPKYIASGEIDVELYRGLTLSVFMTATAGSGYAFYDVSHGFISGASVPSGQQSTTPQRVTAPVPSNAKYIRFTGYTDYSTTITDYPMYIADGIVDLVDDLPRMAKSAVIGEIDLSGVTFTAHSYINVVNGGVSFLTNSKYLASDYIPLSGLDGQTMHFYCTAISSCGGAFYDVDNNFLGSFGAGEVTTPATMPQDVAKAVPVGTAFYRFTGYTDYSSVPTKYYAKLPSNITVIKTNDAIMSEIVALSAKINNDRERNLFYASLSMFEHFAVIGDSYASGEIYLSGSGADYYPLSWGQNIARMCGNECVNLSQGGLTTKSWLIAQHGLPLMLNTDAQQLYMICLGLNDHTKISQGEYTIGSSDDLHEDYSQNADTFYGNYGKIIGNIKTYAPNAKIIMCTVTEGTVGDFSDVNAAIIDLASIFSLPLIQLQDDDFFTSAYYKNSLVSSHPVAASYSGYAMGIMRLFSRCAQTYKTYFNDYVG